VTQLIGKRDRRYLAGSTGSAGILPASFFSARRLFTIHDLRFTAFAMQTAHNWHLKFWRLPHLDNLELLHASRVTHDYPRHMHEEYSIALILQGTETTTCRGTSHKARSGHLLLINAEEVHSNKSAGSEYRLIKVRPKTLQHVASDLGDHTLAAPYFPKLVVKDPLLFRRLLDLHLKLEQNISALEHESVFLSTIGLLLTRLNKNYCAPRSIAKAGSEEVYVRLVRDYLRSHYAENVSLTQLTSLTNLSPFYLLRVFHNRAGFPPHEYQTQVRIAHARKLIRNGTSLSQAALETGFFDQSHLSRNFKRIVGVTPRQYFSDRPA
jgi:AraC-like DNA-binding protein